MSVSFPFPQCLPRFTLFAAGREFVLAASHRVELLYRQDLSALCTFLRRHFLFFRILVRFPSPTAFLEIAYPLVMLRAWLIYYTMQVVDAIAAKSHYLLSPFPQITPRLCLDESLSRLPCPTSASDHPNTWHRPLNCHRMSPASFINSE